MQNLNLIFQTPTFDDFVHVCRDLSGKKGTTWRSVPSVQTAKGDNEMEEMRTPSRRRTILLSHSNIFLFFLLSILHPICPCYSPPFVSTVLWSQSWRQSEFQHVWCCQQRLMLESSCSVCESFNSLSTALFLFTLLPPTVPVWHH